MAKVQRKQTGGNVKLEKLGELCRTMAVIVRETSLDYDNKAVQSLVREIEKECHLLCTD